MDKFCSICAEPISKRSRTGICKRCYSREYQRQLRLSNQKELNKYQNDYYHNNKDKIKEYRENYTKKNNKTFVYFAVYEDGLYIGSTYWGIQRKSYHLNNLDDRYTQYVMNHQALSFYNYDLPKDISNRHLRLLEAFLINKIDPKINMKKMANHFKFEFSELSLIYKIDQQSDTIIEWAKTIPEISRLL